MIYGVLKWCDGDWMAEGYFDNKEDAAQYCKEMNLENEEWRYYYLPFVKLEKKEDENDEI